MKNRLITFFSTTFFTCLFDQVSKNFFLNVLKECGNKDILRFFSLTLVKNYGIILGLLNNEKINFFLIPFSIIIIFIIFLYVLISPKNDNYLQFSLGLIEGGVIGNLIDRIKNGYIIDFINFHFWPVFNFADSFITIGMSLFFIKYFRE